MWCLLHVLVGVQQTLRLFCVSGGGKRRLLDGTQCAREMSAEARADAARIRTARSRSQTTSSPSFITPFMLLTTPRCEATHS